MKRVLAVVLSLFFGLSLLSGCGSQDGISGTQAPQASSAGTVPESAADAGTGFPIVKDKITLKMLAAQNAVQAPFGELELFKKMAELTNIDFEFGMISDENINEKKSLIFASGELPDVFYRALLSIQDEELYGSQGMLIPLEDLIAENAPHLNQLLQDDPGIRKAITALDGHIYTLPYIVRTQTMAGAILWINNKWLSDLSMNMPATTDELYETLKAFKERDPNHDGKNNIIPISCVKTTMLNKTLLYAFGMPTTQTASGNGIPGRYGVKDGKAIYIPTTDNYKQYLQYLNKLYSENLLDNEIFIQNDQTMYAKGKEGRFGVLTTSPSRVAALDKISDYLVLPPLTSPVNSVQMTEYIPGVSTGTFALSSACKYPEAMVRWVDTFYRDEKDMINGISGLSLWLGDKDVHWDYADSGKTRFKRLISNPDLSIEEYLAKKVSPGTLAGVPANVVSNMVEDGNAFLQLKASESSTKYFPFMKESYPDLVRYTKDEMDRIATLENDLNTYVNLMEAKFITGDESFDKWNNFIDAMKKMKVDELMTIKQTAYDRWNSIK